jgi:AhpD family alkylhydroperoxidase
MTAKVNCNQVVPNAPKALGGVYRYVMQSGLPTELAEFACLRDSPTNNCACCLDMHTFDLIKRVVKVRRLSLVPASKAGCGFFSAAESATRVAETMVPDSA